MDRFCIKTIRFSILVNGELEGVFPSERGLRQGNPLSPFLFILVTEGLNSMLSVATQNRCIRGLEVSSRAGVSTEICQLLYVDDTVIFCEAKVDQIKYIRVILVILESISGLRVNWRKSNLFLIKEVAQMQRLANILGCKIEQFQTTYLGIPLGSKHEELLIWMG